MIGEIYWSIPNLRKSKLLCPFTRTVNDLFFSLVDYRNNYFSSDDPDKISEFYNGFNDRDQLIQWMKERPKGVANIHEVDGDKDIIVVIPTADFNGKYAKECRENIFKGLHMVFVESGGKGDLYFNYAQNCNVGTKKAMEYNPKWVVVSNDDMKPVDSISILLQDLVAFQKKNIHLVLSSSRISKENITYLGKNTLIRTIIYSIHSDYTRKILNIESKFNIKFFSHGTGFINKLIYWHNLKFPAIGDFAIFNSSLFNGDHNLFDPVFINGNEDIDSALQLVLNDTNYAFTKFNIKSIGGASLGKRGRAIKDLASLIYLNYKIDKLNIKQVKVIK